MSTLSQPPWPYLGPPRPPPQIDLLGLGTTLGQVIANHGRTHEAHIRSIGILEDIREDIRRLPLSLAQHLDHQHRRRSLIGRLKRLKTLAPVLSGLVYVAAMAAGKLGLWDGLLRIAGLIP